MPPDALEILRRVNDNLRSALARLRPERTHCSTLQPQDFSALLSHVLQASECLRNIHSHSVNTAWPPKNLIEKETLEYRGHLENLKRSLPDLHLRMLAERARLETARSHLSATSAWAGARNKTL
jgi:hypothetical protein